MEVTDPAALERRGFTLDGENRRGKWSGRKGGG
jgi:hypothetical protein